MQGYETIRIEAGPARLRAFARGRGPTVVALPGMGRPPHDLDRFARVIAAAGYRVILPEPRGIGESSGPLEDLTFHDLARDVAAVVEGVGGAPVAMIGHAFGNRIARTLAADRPDLVALVVLLSCSGRVQPPAEVAAGIKLALSVHLPVRDRLDAIRTYWFGPGRDIEPWIDGWSVPAIQAFLRATEATLVSDFWTAGRAPILIVQGLADVAVPAENGRLLKAEVGDRATLVELPGIGHALPVEAPEEVAAPVLAYLAERFTKPVGPAQ